MTVEADKKHREFDRITAEIASIRQYHAELIILFDKRQGVLHSLEGCLKDLVKGGVKHPLPAPDIYAQHRRNHRTGVPAKLDADHELRAFVTARLATMTFDAIIVEIARSFPKDRRITRSSVQRWWVKNRARL